MDPCEIVKTLLTQKCNHDNAEKLNMYLQKNIWNF